MGPYLETAREFFAPEPFARAVPAGVSLDGPNQNRRFISRLFTFGVLTLLGLDGTLFYRRYHTSSDNRKRYFHALKPICGANPTCMDYGAAE